MTEIQGGPLSPPASPVRGAPFFRRVDQALAWLDGILARWAPPERNPLACAGAVANLALIAAVASGVLLLVWYSPSVQFAYPSLAALRGASLGGVVRAIHRYSSDLAMLMLIVHAGRVFVARKFGEARWLPWVSGVAMLAIVWLIGWTGYWLVWDRPAQEIAVSSMRLLDGLPIFGEPLGRLYVSDRTVPSLLFFVVFFLHMLLPLAIAVGLAIHLVRVSRARLLPPRGLAFALLGGLVVAAILIPAPLDAPARMAEKASTLLVDAWYLSPLALGLRFQHAGLWIALFGGMALSAAIPWLLGRRRAATTYQASVTVSRCHACTQCVQDCPFDAITMVPRTDGKKFASQAQVDPARCVGCGVCAGSCDSEGIALTWFDTRIQEAQLERDVASAAAAEPGGRAWVALACAEMEPGPDVPFGSPGISLNRPAGRHDVRERWSKRLPGYSVHFVPTSSWVRPKLVERLLATHAAGVLVVRDARAEAWSRDGRRWVAERLAGTRTPIFRPERAGSEQWLVADFDPARPQALTATAEEFRRGRAVPPQSRRGAWPGALALCAVLLAAAVAPSHLRVTNPASAEPELVLSFKALGERVEPAPLDPAVEATKPVYMRGRSTEKPHRADVLVRITIDGVAEEHVYRAKGISRDGPAIGEVRRRLASGEHDIAIELVHTGARTAPSWHRRVMATPRHVTALTYDVSAGFTLE